jgi:electron transport complex protein RnfG
MNEPDPIEVVRRESSVLRIATRTAAIMLAFTLIFTALMAGTYRATAPLVAASALAEKLRLIGEVLPPGAYDNDLMADAISLPPTRALGLDDETRLWRARTARPRHWCSRQLLPTDIPDASA